MKRIYFPIKTILLAILLTLSGVISAQVTITLGSGTTVHGNMDAGPINEYYESSHSQMVYTAAELTAAGAVLGSIQALGFYVESGVTDPLPNFTIKLKHTTATNAAIYDGTGLTTYYNTSSYNPSPGGFDMLPLPTPFIWNGVDNILVDVCFDPVTLYSNTGIVRIYNTVVTNGYINIRDDGFAQCGLACTDITNRKPQIQFEFPTPPLLDLGINALLKPLGSKACYGTDTIITRLKNYGSNPVDFSINPTTITVNSTGPNAGTYSLALTTGTLASNATQDYTISTSYNLSVIGTYHLKAYTSVAGDGSGLNDTIVTSIIKKPSFITNVSPNDSVCLGVPVQLNASYYSLTGTQVGNGSVVNGGSTYPTPYGHYYGGAKHQFLYRASELTANGVVPGNINGIKFNITNLNSVSALTNYNISIATTSLTAITALQSTGFTTYYSSASYSPVLGSNGHTFSTPFVWDGVSNIIVDVCFNNNDYGPTGGNASVSQSTTAFSSSVWYRADANPSVCSSTSATSNTSQRPNTWFIQAVGIPYTWSPSTELTANNISNPIANITGSRTYTVTGNVGGCVTYDTVRIYLKPTPTPNLGHDSMYCNLPVILNANTLANSFLWNNNTIGSSLSITTSGKYWVRATNTSGCSNSDTVLVSVGNTPIVTLGPDTAYCQGSTINLYAGFGPGLSYLWSNGSTASSITVGTVGTYSVAVTNSIGCQSSDVVNVTSKSKPTVSLVFNGVTSFCTTDNITKVLTEGTPSNGTYIGAGVTTTTGTSSFNPTQASQGIHIILYNYTAPNGCSNIAKDTLTVSPCVGIEELTSSIRLTIYPNPTSGIITMELTTNKYINGSVIITSIDGKIVYNDTVSGNDLISKSISLSDLADGIYYLKLETKDTVKTYKILKQ